MSKRRRVTKRVQKRRRVFSILAVGAILLALLLISRPYVQHISAYRNAVAAYDFEALAQELTWIENEATWLKKIPFVHEGELWLKLNLGDHEGLEFELANQEDSHPLWLFQFHLIKGHSREAQKVMEAIEDPALRKLAKGLLEAAEGEREKAANTLFTISDSDLSPEDLVLRDIAITRSYLALEKYDRAQKTWQAATEIAPEHPLVIASEYDLALATGQWGRAKELSRRQVVTTINSPYIEQILVKKALLALVVGDRESYQSTLEELKKKDKGEACIQYLVGLEVYERGEFRKAEQYLQEALNLGLPNFLKEDASLALTQAMERLEAEAAVKAVTGY